MRSSERSAKSSRAIQWSWTSERGPASLHSWPASWARAVYVLSERENGKAPFADPLPAHAGLMMLIENAYVSYLLDKIMRARDFDLLGRLVSSVPLRRVVPHTDSAYLSRLRDAIIDDF